MKKMKKNLVYCLLFIVVVGVSPTFLMAQNRVVVIPLFSESTNTSVILNTTIRTNYSDMGTSYGSTGSEIVSVSCNADEIITGGTCEATSENMNSDTTNWGVVHACDIADNFILGNGYADFILYDPNKYGPAFTVHAVCAKLNSTIGKTSSKEALSSSGSLEDAKAKLQTEMEEYKQAYESKMLSP